MLKILLAIWLSSLTIASFAKSLVGLSDVELTSDFKIPLGGYGSASRRYLPFHFFTSRPFLRLFKPALGSLDPIRAKVMTLKNDDKRIIWISLDVVGAPAEIHKALSEKLSSLGIKPEELFVSATHTHSGPGALSKNHFWQVFAMDRFQSGYYNFFIDQIVSAVKSAIESETPARLFSHRFSVEGLTHRRRSGEGEIDKEVTTLLARTDDGRWLGGIVNFAIHGVCLDDENLYFSSDAPGSIERSVEKYLGDQNPFFSIEEPTILMINGAEGDVSPNHYGEEGIKRIGDIFVEKFRENMVTFSEVTSEIKLTSTEVNLGTPRVYLRKCVDKDWIPTWFGLRIKRYINSTVTLSQIKLGEMVFASSRGEPTSALGLELKRHFYQNGFDRVMIMGLTNDHLAYFTTAAEFSAGGYESCVNFFGPLGGEQILKNHKDLLKK